MGPFPSIMVLLVWNVAKDKLSPYNVGDGLASSVLVEHEFEPGGAGEQ